MIPSQFWKSDIRERITLWLPWLIISAVIALSALIGLGYDHLPLKLLAIAAAGGLYALLALRNLPLALTVVVLVSAPSGFTLGTGRATPLPLGFLLMAFLCGVWLLRMLLEERRVRLQPSPFNRPAGLFLLAALLSWLIGNLIWDYRLYVNKNLLIVQGGQFALYLLSFGAAWLTAHQSLSERLLKTWTVIVIALGIGEMALELLGQYGGRSRGLTGSIFIFSIPLLAAQLAFNPALSRRWKVAAVLGLGIWAIWVPRTLDWKGGWLPALVGLGVLLLFRPRREILLAGLLGLGLVVLGKDWLYQQVVASDFGSGGTRPYIWQDIARLVLPRSPLFGLGLANYMYYWFLPGFIPSSRLFAGWDKWNAYWYAIPSHSMYVDTFAQTGLIGLGLLLWALGALLLILLRVIRRLPPGFLRAYALGVLGGYVGILFASFSFADWLIPFVYNITITGFAHSVYAWMLVGSVVGLFYRLEGQEIERTA